MDQQQTNNLQISYDRVAEEYVKRIFEELAHKPFLSRKINLFALRGDISAIIASPLAYEIESSGVGNSVRVVFRTDRGSFGGQAV